MTSSAIFILLMLKGGLISRNCSNQTMGANSTSLNMRDIYQSRFKGEFLFRDKMWKTLCENYFQQFIDDGATVLEVAAGHCEFINNIKAQRRIAVDINEDTCNFANDRIEVYNTSSSDLSPISSNNVNVVFISNFFEHISKDEIINSLKECYRVMSGRGKLLILQPNIRYCYKNYWMFYDHITPLDDRAICEALEITGFRIVQSLPRFLPYTTKSNFPRFLFLIKLYLKIPLAWKLFGSQALVIAEK